MSKYKWANPNEWLIDVIKKTDDIQTLKSIFFSFISGLDSDYIQDIFQDEMDADGYFDIVK
jgi:hypothetical protein